MHIGYIIARFYPFKGGAEQNCWQLATRSAAQGHQVTVLTSDASPTAERLQLDEHISGIRILRAKAWNKQLNLGFYPALLPQILKVDADVIHVCNGAGFIWRDFCLFWKRIFSPKTCFIITPHGPFLVTPNTHDGVKALMARIAKLLLKPYFTLLWSRLFDWVIAVNPKQEKWLTKDLGFKKKKIIVIPNGIDSNLLQDKLPARKYGKLAADDKESTLTLGYVGRMEKYKGLHKVLMAISKSGLEKVKFVIMGSGIYEQELLQLISNFKLESQVEVVINPSDRKRDQLMTDEIDCMVLLSDWEATGIVLLEGMAKGCFIITNTNNEAASTIVANGKNGYIIDATAGNNSEVNQLMTILVDLVGKHDRVLALQAAALESAAAWTWDSIFSTYLNLLDSVRPEQHK